LTITVATSSQDYSAREDIEIFGNLTLNGLPVQALVALQVNDPLGPIILRTLQTGEDYEVGSFEILTFYSCYKNGTPKTTFEAGTLAWLKMSVKNTGNTTEYVLVMANAYDSNNSNLGLSAGAFVPVIEGTVLTKISSLYIPTAASPGNATAYVNALTNWPTQGGVPYYPEMSTQFEIISPQGSGGQSLPAQGSQISENGTYNLTFKLLRGAKLGNYTVFVSSAYQGIEVTESTTFNVHALPGDANGDGFVDVSDFAILGKAWFTGYGDPGYDARADFNGDGFIDVSDFAILGKNWFT